MGGWFLQLTSVHCLEDGQPITPLFQAVSEGPRSDAEDERRLLQGLHDRTARSEPLQNLGNVGELRSESLANRCGHRPELSPDVDGVSHPAAVTQPSRLASALPRRRWKGGGPCRIRTCGLRIRSPTLYPTELRARRLTVAEREGFEPSIQLWTVYWFSKPAPSASRPPLPASVQPLPRATCPRKRSVLDRALPGVKDGLEWDCNAGTSSRAADALVFLGQSGRTPTPAQLDGSAE